jgi:CHASE2 domain-containing sensor protein
MQLGGAHLVTPWAHIATLLERVARSKPLAVRPAAIGLKRVNGHLVAAKDNVMFTSPLFERDGDGKVRRWKLFAEACNGAAPMIVPSMHLAPAMIARQAIYGAPKADDIPPLERMTRRLAAFTPANCERTNGEREGTLDSLSPDGPIQVEHDEVSKRVIYRVAWEPGVVGLGPIVELAANVGGGEMQLVEVRPARLVAPGDSNAALPGLEGRIVVIGGSFESGGDYYNTPLGVMPGSLMIVNAIEALTQNGTPREFQTPFRIVISLLVIVVASLLTLCLGPIVAAAALSAFLLMLVFALLNRFQAGAVLDLAVPAVGALVHDLWESTVTMAREMRRLRWRWLLKPRSNEDSGVRQPHGVAEEGADG